MNGWVMPVTLAATLAGCGSSTGGALVTFHAEAAGPTDAVAGQPLVFSTAPRDANNNVTQYQVTLTRAVLHIGAIYLNHAVPISGAQPTSCILPGIYVGEVLTALDVDTLSPDPQPFASEGVGTSLQALTGEVWLTGGDINARDDSTVIADVAGTATQGSTTYPFTGQITIGANRAAAQSPPFPNQHPLCRQRIVSPIDLRSQDLSLAQGGTLLVRVDPRLWFAAVDFAQLPVDTNDPAGRRFLDANDNSPDIALYSGVRAATGVYSFKWQSP